MPHAPTTHRACARSWSVAFCVMQLGYINKVDAATRQLQHVPVFNDQRFSHSWVIGKTGVGKSTALVRWAIDDILAGDGLAFFDPHGDTAEELLRRMPPERLEDVVYFNPAEFAIGFNIFDTIPEERKAFRRQSQVGVGLFGYGHTCAEPVSIQWRQGDDGCARRDAVGDEVPAHQQEISRTCSSAHQGSDHCRFLAGRF